MRFRKGISRHWDIVETSSPPLNPRLFDIKTIHHYLFYPPFIMLFTTPTLLAFLSATLAVAAPTASPDYKPSYHNRDKYNKDCDDDWDKKWKGDGWKKTEKLFYFDAEYVVKATPDQVIANNGTATPGQPGAKGIFKYGINVQENTICYVGLSTSNTSITALTNQTEHHALRCHWQLQLPCRHCNPYPRGREG
jgi:hypothetical protein